MFRDLMCSGGRFIAFLLLSNVVLISSVSAADDIAGDNKTLPYDVRIVVDISGSMKQTDPNNLRISALNLLLELMPEGAQAGIWTFGQYVNNLVPVAPVDEQWRSQAKVMATKVSSLGLKTNLTGALNDAAWGLSADSGFQQSIILLTDGKVDMAASNDPKADAVNALERQALMAQVLEKYRVAGANVHTLALSDLADKNLLQQIALETDGLYSQASSAEELMKAFLRAFDQAVPAEQVPMEDNTFSIDDSVNEFTALIFKRSGGQETALLTPEGDRFTQAQHPKTVRWHRDVSFDLVTIKAPEVGTWVAEADLDPSNRVTILSDLALNVEGVPATIFPGDKLDVEINMINEGVVVKKPELLRLTDITMKVVTASGREGSKILSDPENPPADGIYREGLYRLKELGQYQVDVIAEGRTFQRKRSFSMTMIQPVEITHRPDIEKKVYRIEVRALSDNLDVERSRVIAKVRSPDENTIIQSVVYDVDIQAWVSEVEASKGPGEYRVDLNIRGITQSGKNFKVKPESIVFSLPIIDPNQPKVNSELVDDIAPNLSMADVNAKESPVEMPPEAVDPPKPEREAEQMAAKNAENVKSNEKETAPDPEALAEDVEEEGLAWWIYLLLVLLNIGVIGAGVWWFMFRKAKPVVDAQTSLEREGTMTDLDELEEDFSGDFDSLDEGNEEDIPAAGMGPSTGMDMGELDADNLSSSKVDSSVEQDSLDEDFSIDPDDGVDTDEDSWGEFDSDKKE